MANNLAADKKVMAVSMLAEGNSIRAIERVTGVHRDTIMRLGVRVGEGCEKIMDERMRNIQSTAIEIDEIWGLIGKKKKNVQAFESGVGDVWTFIALDPNTKLIPCFLVGQRTLIYAREFLTALESRLANRVQLSADGLAAYRESVAGVFGGDVDFGQVVKTYSICNLNQSAAGRYSPAEVVKTEKTVVCGRPSFPKSRPRTSRSRTTRCGCTAADLPASRTLSAKRLKTLRLRLRSISLITTSAKQTLRSNPRQHRQRGLSKASGPSRNWLNAVANRIVAVRTFAGYIEMRFERELTSGVKRANQSLDSRFNETNYSSISDWMRIYPSGPDSRLSGPRKADNIAARKRNTGCGFRFLPCCKRLFKGYNKS